MFALSSSRKLKVKVLVFFATRFTPVSRKMAGRGGSDIVQVFGFSGVIISIKLINVYISHDSSLGGCFSKRVRIYCIGKAPLPRSQLDGMLVRISF